MTAGAPVDTLAIAGVWSIEGALARVVAWLNARGLVTVDEDALTSPAAACGPLEDAVDVWFTSVDDMSAAAQSLSDLARSFGDDRMAVRALGAPAWRFAGADRLTPAGSTAESWLLAVVLLPAPGARGVLMRGRLSIPREDVRQLALRLALRG